MTAFSPKAPGWSPSWPDCKVNELNVIGLEVELYEILGDVTVGLFSHQLSPFVVPRLLLIKKLVELGELKVPYCQVLLVVFVVAEKLPAAL